jgi:hypothetical protein
MLKFNLIELQTMLTFIVRYYIFQIFQILLMIIFGWLQRNEEVSLFKFMFVY